jgi:ketosteroid isomerase-like protein
MSEQNQEAQVASQAGNALSRRAAMAAATGMAASALLVGSEADAGDPIAALIQLAEEKNAAFMRGDMARWASLVRFAPDFTLMQPFGGPVSHGFDPSPGKLAQMSEYFRNGRTELELAKTYASSNMVVLVMIERQRAEVGGLPDQDWSLRVTEVYREDAGNWQLVHCHADPLVQRITLHQAAALARGQPDQQ